MAWPLPYALRAARSCLGWGSVRLVVPVGSNIPVSRGSSQTNSRKDAYNIRLFANAAAGVLATGTDALRYGLATEIEKPETHRNRTYQHITLENGLQAVLASDPTCDKASGALCVGVGRLHEPKALPGLAHFCEHMLFLGTERFPDEAEYKRYVKRHGGTCNASTSDTQTCYAFDVAPPNLAGVLDRFSQFFVAPLFTPSATEREIDAVDSEHSMRITDDGRRSYATLLLDANPAHPLHWGSGNARSLRDEPRALGIDVHAEVVRFHREFYSAEDMTLAVLGRHPLDELREMVASRFAAVRSTGRRASRGPELGGGQPAILPEDFRGLVLRTPSKTIRQLILSWQLTDWQVPLWRTKPAAYASHLIGHEGEGSLLSALKARGWATALHAGVDEFGAFSLFRIGVILTEAGLENVEAVGSIMFRYLRLLRGTPVQRWLQEEMQTLREIHFRYADDMRPYSLVDVLARNLQYYPAEEVLVAPWRLVSLDAGAAAGILELLTPDTVRVELVAKSLEGRCTQHDPWYGGRFLRLPLEERWRAAWGGEDAHDVDPALAAADHGLRLPQPNPFLPEDLSLRALPAELSSWPLELPQGGAAPASLRHFHRQDDRFKQPKAWLAFRFHSPAAAMDAASHLRCRVWCSSVIEELNEYSYDAADAGLSYALYSVPGGFELAVVGFNDKLALLLRTVVKKMRTTSSLTASTYRIVCDRLERSLTNQAFKQRPCDQASRKARELRFSLGFPPEDQLAALRAMSTTDLDNEHSRLLSACHLEVLSTGNLSTEDAEAAVAIVVEELHLERSLQRLPMRAEAMLPPGRTLWRIDGTDSEEQNNCVRCELQLPLNLDSAAKVAILVRILSPRFFEEIRTKQQLGYITQMAWAEHEGSLSVICIVQTEYAPDLVRSRIDVCLETLFDWIQQDLEEADFLRQRDGLASNLAEAPKNLGEASGRYWAEIAKRRYDFARRDRKLNIVQGTSLSALRDFVCVHVRSAPRLYVEVHSIAPYSSKAPAPLPQDAEAAKAAIELDRIWSGPEVARDFRAGALWVELDSSVSTSLAPASRL